MVRKVDVGVISILMISGWVFLMVMTVPSMLVAVWQPWDLGLSTPMLDILIFMTEAGSEFAMLGLAAAVYWVYDRKLGKKLFLLFLISGWFNVLAKGMFALSRPPDPKAHYTIEYSFPSGHTQLTASLLSYIALHFNKWSWFTLYLFLTLFIAFTRVALQVHYPADVIFGLFFGTFIGLGFNVFQRGVSSNKVLDRSNVRSFMVLVIPMLSLAFLILFLDVVPVQAFQLAGLAVGFGSGDTVLRDRHVPLPVHWWGKIACVILGIVILSPLVLLMLLVPETNNWTLFVVMVVAGFTISGVVPFVYKRLKDFSSLG